MKMASSRREDRMRAELAEANCMADFYRAAAPAFAHKHGLYLQQTRSYTATLARDSHEFGMYNRVFALGVETAISELELEQVMQLYHSAGVSYQLRISPSSQPEELQNWLIAKGFHHIGDSARFYAQPRSQIDSDHQIRIHRVAAQEAEAFASIACLGHGPELQAWLRATVGRAGWYHYLAFVGEKPAASGVLYVQGKTGWLGWALTLPAQRGRGAQRALLAHRINEALRLGCDLVTAETRAETANEPNPSYRNLLRMGFHLAYLRQHYHYDHL